MLTDRQLLGKSSGNVIRQENPRILKDSENVVNPLLKAFEKVSAYLRW